ncbi:universal stress protein PHOS32-like [Telopea speciosissima]|uniref:universal stress protein PHOS32-like n=1 Tax=Telopea speciosissima TaxID=54955 RepID=UPI001CC48094|nr:universal stress protein PHOS32-like [Telopea speciosissima]
MALRRNVGVAVDFSPCSRDALKWASENLVKEGDHLILISVQPSSDYEQGAAQLWQATGSPLVPLMEFSDPGITKKYGVKPDAETLGILNTISTQNGVEVLAKIYWGDAGLKICEAIADVPLNCLVMGSRGLTGVKRALLGSVSRYVINHAVCPVTIVKDSQSRQ